MSRLFVKGKNVFFNIVYVTAAVLQLFPRTGPCSQLGSCPAQFPFSRATFRLTEPALCRCKRRNFTGHSCHANRAFGFTKDPVHDGVKESRLASSALSHKEDLGLVPSSTTSHYGLIKRLPHGFILWIDLKEHRQDIRLDTSVF